MKWFMRLNGFVKSTLTLGSVLLIYGYFCRIIGLFFFWESKSIGWAFIFISLIGFLFGRIKYKKQQGRKAILEIIGIGFIMLLLLAQLILVIAVPNMNAYSAIQKFVNNDEELKKELGHVNAMTVIPTGSISESSDREGESGEGQINLTVKGEKKYKDISFYVHKEFKSGWQVEIIK